MSFIFVIKQLAVSGWVKGDAQILKIYYIRLL